MSGRIELGAEVVDVISGFRGVVTARAEHLGGWNRLWVQPKVGADGKYADGIWCDDISVEVVSGPIKLPRG